MSLTSFPRQEVVYEVDNSSVPAKMNLTFRETPCPSTSQGTQGLTNSVPSPAEGKTKSLNRSNVQSNSGMKEADEELEKAKQEKLKKVKEMKKRRREEFVDRGVMKALYGAVEHKVRCVCNSKDQFLGQKRTRLRELLLAEEVAYTTEYIAMCQEANANREEELRSRALYLEKKTERERKEFADQKLLERKIENCDAARPVRTRKTLMEVKKDQLWQIKEKYAMNEAKREEERMYHDLMIKNMLALKENEEENAKLAWMKQKDAQKAFMEQMKWKEQKEMEERQLKEWERLQIEEEMRLVKEENEKNLQEKLQKKVKMKAEFQELLEREKETKERRKREEEEIDRTFAELMKIEEEKEKREEGSNKERLKREMDTFLKHNRELKRLKEEEEKKLDQMIEELNEKKRIQKDMERRRYKAAREELFCTVLKERQGQVKEKQEREQREEEQRRKEIELLTLQMEQQNKIREEYERRCAEQREQYKCQLLQQIQEAEETRRRKKEEEEEYVRMKKAEEERDIQEVEALLRALPIGGRNHPMKTILKEEPPKFVCPFPCPR